MSRILVHFSCGAASAVAWKITVSKFGADNEVEAIYCDLLNDEHPDNRRFMSDCEKWVGRKVNILSNQKYDTIDELFLAERFMVTPYGAICTKLMKRQVRERYQRAGDKHVFGLTVDENSRIALFNQRNPMLNLLWVLQVAEITKEDCYHILSAAGIELPEMYKLGYGHNNCIGCVKGGRGYWNKIRHDFPEVFALRAATQRELQCTFGSGENGFYLDELDPNAGKNEPSQDIECGPICRAEYSDLIKDIPNKLIPLTTYVTPPAPTKLRGMA